MWDFSVSGAPSPQRKTAPENAEILTRNKKQMLEALTAECSGK